MFWNLISSKTNNQLQEMRRFEARGYDCLMDQRVKIDGFIFLLTLKSKMLILSYLKCFRLRTIGKLSAKSYISANFLIISLKAINAPVIIGKLGLWYKVYLNNLQYTILRQINYYWRRLEFRYFKFFVIEQTNYQNFCRLMNIFYELSY